MTYKDKVREILDRGEHAFIASELIGQNHVFAVFAAEKTALDLGCNFKFLPDKNKFLLLQGRE